MHSATRVRTDSVRMQVLTVKTSRKKEDRLQDTLRGLQTNLSVPSAHYSDEQQMAGACHLEVCLRL